MHLWSTDRSLRKLDRLGVILRHALRQRKDYLFARTLRHRCQQIEHPLDLMRRSRRQLPDADLAMCGGSSLLVVAGELFIELLTRANSGDLDLNVLVDDQ